MMNEDSGFERQPSTSRWSTRLSELGVHWNLPADTPQNMARTAVLLKERVKELNCVYAITHLMEAEPRPFDEFLASVVDILPPSWQYPNVACACITMDNRTYTSLYYEDSPWRMTAPIPISGGIGGEVSVSYTALCPEADEGPFLKEERHLLNSVALRIGQIASRRETESRLAETNRQLDTERTALREANAALRVVLDRIEAEKIEIQQNILENVRRILLPIVRELTMSSTPDQKEYLALLEENLAQIASPFVRQLSRKYQSLTTTEVRICGMIRGGLSSKEIANLRDVSPATISRHREHIRQKLGIANSKVNLATFLQSTM
jgi:DNA-binding CsgD family transcriptional regulator